MNLRYDIHHLICTCTIIGISLAVIGCSQPTRTQSNAVELSPRVSCEYMLNNKRIKVDYGSPSLRGREVMGKRVPYDKVWGTGAGKGTIFSTEIDLVIDDKVVPKGSYTLLTLPSKDNSWKLILNKDIDLYCITPYDSAVQSRELLRVDMKKEVIDTPVERLQYSFSPAGADLTMKIQWEKISVYVDIKAKDMAKKQKQGRSTILAKKN
jgi:DUF2911 family protein